MISLAYGPTLVEKLQLLTADGTTNFATVGVFFCFSVVKASEMCKL